MLDIPPEYVFPIVQVSRGHRKTDLLNKTEYPDLHTPEGIIRLPYLSAVLRLGDEIDVAADRNPSILYDNVVMLTQKDEEAFHSHEAIKNVTIETGRILLEVKTDDAEVLEYVRDIVGKIRETLHYCREIAQQRSNLRITQESVEMAEGGEDGRND